MKVTIFFWKKTYLRHTMLSDKFNSKKFESVGSKFTQYKII